jgi:adenine C2-methylase RlmN of 23S rRNA A2503 and tRNA A37
MEVYLMEVYRTKDNEVSKFVHYNGAETAIKTVSSCDNEVDRNGHIIVNDVDRRKFSVFISSSVGCPVGCKFCYLTVKKYPYYKLSSEEIFDNFKNALDAELEHKPELKDMYIKLSWMGMGDALFLDPRKFVRVTVEMLSYAMNAGIKGVDGVDVSTVMPPKALRKGWPHQLGSLNDVLYSNFKLNPYNKHRSPLRLFYSLHSPLPYVRNKLIPLYKCEDVHEHIEKDLNALEQIRFHYGVDYIIHYMFLEGQDDNSCIMLLEKLMNDLKNVELRVLRYNTCDGSSFAESVKFDDIVMHLVGSVPKLKYQVSAGSEIKAACGQFLCLTNK